MKLSVYANCYQILRLGNKSIYNKTLKPMKLQTQTVHVDPAPELIDFIQRKVDKLETFYDRIINGEVFLKMENGEAIENKIVEIKLNIPGNQLFAKEQAESFEAAADAAVNALRRQLKKHKDKLASH